MTAQAGPAPEARFSDLQQALGSDDPGRLDREVDELAAAVASHPDPDSAAATAYEALRLLRRNRKFRPMLRVAEGAFRAGVDSAGVSNLYAQALIEEGLLGAALAVLGQVPPGPGGEAEETIGLIGRAHKERYATTTAAAGGERDLRAAIDAYLGPFEASPAENLWHGINAVALLARAQRDGISIAGRPDWKQMAEQLLATIRSRPPEKRGVWDLAVEAEAHVALGDFRSAGKRLASFTQLPEVDAFAIAGTLRQLRQVWQIDEANPIQRVLVDLLEARLLNAKGGGLEVDAPKRAKELALDDTLLELSFSDAAYQTIQWYRAGLEAARSVVRIVRPLVGTVGTGFVLPGAALHPLWAERAVVLTNFHVTNRLGVYPGLSPAHLRVVFEDSGINIRVQDILWESPTDRVGTNPPGTLDATVMALELDPVPAPSYEISPPPDPTPGQRVYVIGYPLGKDLAFSLQDNKVVGVTDTLLHYRAPTDPGSSGSPVFDRQWQVVGLHHGGGRTLVRIDDPGATYEANEGMLFTAIRDRVRREIPLG